MAFITTYNKSKFNNKNTLSENTWFKYPYIYNIVGNSNRLYVYRKDVVDNTSELYGTIDTSNVIPINSGVVDVCLSTRCVNTKDIFIVLGGRVSYYEYYLCKIDIIIR